MHSSVRPSDLYELLSFTSIPPRQTIELLLIGVSVVLLQLDGTGCANAGLVQQHKADQLRDGLLACTALTLVGAAKRTRHWLCVAQLDCI